MLGTVHVLAHLVLPTALGGRDDYHPHFTDEETGSEMRLIQGLAEGPGLSNPKVCSRAWPPVGCLPLG